MKMRVVETSARMKKDSSCISGNILDATDVVVIQNWTRAASSSSASRKDVLAPTLKAWQVKYCKMYLTGIISP
jgi:hypothetical protein